MLRITALWVILSLGLLAGCAANSSYSPLIRVEPEADVIAERRPRNLRLYFVALPDVSHSTLTLTGPGGDYPLRGMHSMGADDLMVEITNPAIPDGHYTVQWSTLVEGDPATYSGSFDFTVQAD